MPKFEDICCGFQQVCSDRRLFWKILLGGFLLINPFLLAFAPTFFSQPEHWLARPVFITALVLNVLTFWFPLGFTYEVLRRARTGSGSQLPDWSWSVLPRYFREGAVKLVIAVFTLILPVGIWMGLCHVLFISILGLPLSLLPLFLPPIMLLVIPFCGVACCRWLDGVSVLDCALNYGENFRLFRRGWKSYLIASIFLTGLNSITTAFYYTIPFAAIFGLCLVDTWFGPIYAATCGEESVRPVAVG